MKTWEHLVVKLFTICKWHVSCLYPFSWEQAVGCFFWAFLLRKIIKRPSEVINLLILSQGAYIKRCRFNLVIRNQINCYLVSDLLVVRFWIVDDPICMPLLPKHSFFLIKFINLTYHTLSNLKFYWKNNSNFLINTMKHV